MSDEAVLQAIRTKVVRDLCIPSASVVPGGPEVLDDLVRQWNETTKLRAELNAVQEGLRKALEGLLVQHRAQALIGSTGVVEGREAIQAVVRREWTADGFPQPVLTEAKVSVVELAIVVSPARVGAYRVKVGTGPTGTAINRTGS